MKKICVLLSCLLGGILNAQNYQNICTPGITFFKNSTGNIKAFRQDSVYLPGNNDTVFISYRTIRPFWIDGCYDTTNGSILGRRVYKKHDGTFFFFNWNHDTLTLKTQATMNETWKFCNLPGGSRIDATVINILPDTILGLPDQVKVISFQAKDLNGNNISHYLNQKIIKLSQHYGISKTFDLYYMPDIEANDTSSYILDGKTALHLGIQNLTWRDVYNFDAGDEFHYSGVQTYWGYGSNSWNTIKRVLEKEVFGNLDSVKYTMEFCKIMYLFQPPPNIETTYDTIVESYDFITLANDETGNQLPEKLINYGDWAPKFARHISFPGRQTQEYKDLSYTLMGNCWGLPFEPYFTTYQYSEGLGNTSKFHMEADFIMMTWQEDLVYFKKGSEIWGTPIAPNCLTLVPVEEKTKPVIPDLRINPNPMETVAEISLEGFKQSGLHYILYNSFGQQVCVREVHSNPFIFNRSGLPGGLYVITVIDDNNSILAIKKIMLK